MQSIGYIPNTFEDKMIYWLEDRSIMEREALETLSENEIKVIEMKYYELMKSSEIAQQLHLSRIWVNKLEEQALRKLRHIILKQKTNMIDSKTGMRENDLENLASSVSGWLECQSTNTSFLRKRHGILSQWLKDLIRFQLTSDERQILLWYHQIKPYPGKLNSDYYETVEGIHKKILGFLTKDNLICEKANYKVRV